MKTTTPETNTPEAQAIRQAIRAGYTIVRTELPHDGARFPDIEEREPRHRDQEPTFPDPEPPGYEAERRLAFLNGFARAAGLDTNEAAERWAEYSADLSPTRKWNAEVGGGEDAGWEMGDKWRKNVKHQKS